MATVGNLQIGLSLLTAPALAALKTFEKSVAASGVRMAAIGAGGIVATAAIAGSVVAAAQWEKEMKGVVRTFEDPTTGDALTLYTEKGQAVSDMLREIAKQAPITHGEIAQIAETAGALGIPLADLENFVTEVMHLSALSEDLTPDAVARAFGKIRTVTGLAAEDFDNFTSAVVALGQAGASTEGEILSMAQRASGVATLMGLEVPELLAMSAAMANIAERSEAGGTSIQRIFLIMQDNVTKANDKLTLLAETMGITREQFAEAFQADPNAMVLAFLAKVSTMETPELFSTLQGIGVKDVRITRGFGNILSAMKNADDVAGDLNESVKISDEAFAAGTLGAIQYAERTDNLIDNTQRLQNKIYDLGITIGDGLVPHLTNLVDMFSGVIDGINAFANSSDLAKAAVDAISLSILALVGGGLAMKLMRMFLPIPAASTMIAGAWSAVFGSRALQGAIGLAGAAAGVLYAQAVAASQALANAMMGLWAALGRPGAALIGRIAAAGAAAGAAFAGGAAGAGFIGTVAAAVAGMAPLAIPFIVAQVASGPVKDVVRGLDIDQRAKDTLTGDNIDNLMANARKKNPNEWRWPWEEGGFFNPSAAKAAENLGGSLSEQLSKIHPSMFKSTTFIDRIGSFISDTFSNMPKVEAPDILPDFAAEFREARKAIATGFGNIKSALASPPQLISRDDRMENMEGKMRKIVKNVKAAVKADDPVNIAYWTQAAGAAAQRMDRIGGKGKTTTADVKAQFKAMGIDVKTTFGGVQTKATTTANSVRTRMLMSAHQTAIGINSAFAGINLVNAGVTIVSTLASGMRAAMPQVLQVAAEVAGVVSGFFKGKSPPRMGPLSTIDTDGAMLVKTLSGGMLSQKRLAAATGVTIAGAFRPALGANAIAANGLRRGGRENHFHIGTLVADDRGIDELDRRMNRRRKMKGRGAMRYQDRD